MITVKRIQTPEITTELITELIAKFPPAEDNPYWALQKAIKFVSNTQNYLFLGYVDGEVAAYTYGYDNDRFDDKKEYFIYEVGTADKFQRQGVMREVFRVMTELLKQEGFVNAWVLADKSNEIGNKFYQAVGGKFNGEESIMYDFKIS